MITDARTFSPEHTLETDVCVLGGGVAGLTLAREFAGQDLDVCILEQGGVDEEEAPQRFNRGDVTGYPYWGLDYARHSQIGGASHRWGLDMGNGQKGARSRPLDQIDFEQRDEIPYSGWPFQKADLDPFYERAQDLFQLGPNRYEAEDWREPDEDLLFKECPSLETVVFQYGSRKAFTRDYSETVRSAHNVTLVHHAKALTLETDETGETVTHVRVATPAGTRFNVSAETVILALGGIENARLLLLSNRIHENGIGNQNDLVGRFFMEHLHFESGILWPQTPDSFSVHPLYHVHERDGTSIHSKLSLRNDVLREAGLRNSCFSLRPEWNPYDTRTASEAYEALRVSGSTLRRGYLPDAPFSKLLTVARHPGPLVRAGALRLKKRLVEWTGGTLSPRAYKVHHFAEQAPNPGSRITLSPRKRDRYGQPRARLNWEISRDDVADVLRGLKRVKDEIEREGQWRLELTEYDQLPPPGIRGGFHHMGTTRMHETPQKGVVDRNSTVHGINNLFITGSSVFPTGGYANPNLTIGALAIRLADHIIERFKTQAHRSRVAGKI